MAKVVTLIFLLFIPLALQAQVYRCDTPQGTIYSQMPCSEDAELLEEYQPMRQPGVESSDRSDDSSASQPEDVDPPSAMEMFISTLERQREDQLSTIDANIKGLQQQLAVTGDQGPDEASRKLMQSQLERQQLERASISEQYAALISEASNRAQPAQGSD